MASLFGWQKQDEETGDYFRRFSMGYVTCARKWGKSSLCAGIALLMLLRDNPIEEGAHVFVAATKRDQAKIVWNTAVQMVKRSPALAEWARCRHSAITSEDESPQPNSTLQAIGSDANRADGFDPHGTILDELHAWQTEFPGRPAP